jgi:hypothetical protein
MLQTLIGYLLEVKAEMLINASAYILAVDLVYRYFQRQPSVDKTEYQLIGLIALYLASEFLNPVYIELEYFVHMGAGSYTIQDGNAMCSRILKSLDYDLLATTPHDKILAQHQNYDTKILKTASNLLVFASPIHELYSDSNLVNMCIQTALSVHGVSASKQSRFEEIFKAYYQSNPIMKSLLSPTLKFYFEIE